MNITMNSTLGKTIIIILAIIGVLALLGTAGMFFMHWSMMGSSANTGLWSSLPGMCRGMARG